MSKEANIFELNPTGHEELEVFETDDSNLSDCTARYSWRKKIKLIKLGRIWECYKRNMQN